MRSPAAVLTMVLGLLMGTFPCHRCAPLDQGGAATTVLLGSHAHEGHGEPEPCCSGHHHEEDAPPCPGHDGDEEPCCVHSSADPTTAPVRAFEAPAAVESCGTIVADVGARAASFEVARAEAPVPRLPTETVVLLR